MAVTYFDIYERVCNNTTELRFFRERLLELTTGMERGHAVQYDRIAPPSSSPDDDRLLRYIERKDGLTARIHELETQIRTDLDDLERYLDTWKPDDLRTVARGIILYGDSLRMIGKVIARTERTVKRKREQIFTILQNTEKAESHPVG